MTTDPEQRSTRIAEMGIAIAELIAVVMAWAAWTYGMWAIGGPWLFPKGDVLLISDPAKGMIVGFGFVGVWVLGLVVLSSMLSYVARRAIIRWVGIEREDATE